MIKRKRAGAALLCGLLAGTLLTACGGSETGDSANGQVTLDYWLWDDNHTRYLDATAALWFCNVGYGRHELARAAAKQMARRAQAMALGARDYLVKSKFSLTDLMDAIRQHVVAILRHPGVLGARRVRLPVCVARIV